MKGRHEEPGLERTPQSQPHLIHSALPETSPPTSAVATRRNIRLQGGLDCRRAAMVPCRHGCDRLFPKTAGRPCAAIVTVAIAATSSTAAVWGSKATRGSPVDDEVEASVEGPQSDQDSCVQVGSLLCGVAGLERICPSASASPLYRPLARSRLSTTGSLFGRSRLLRAVIGWLVVILQACCW